MAVLLGTSKTRFVDFEDPSSGIGKFLNKASSAVNTFLQQVDAMIAEDTFVEDGVQDIAGFSNFDAGFSNIKEPTRRKLYTQTAKGTVFIKKRIFSTLRNNFDPKFLSVEDKTFLRASKHLFRRKCEEIAFYENLVKLENLNDNPGFLRVDGVFGDLLDGFFNLLNIGYGIVSLTDTAAFFEPLFSDRALDPLNSVVDEATILISSSLKLFKVLFKLKEINERSKGSNFTRWVYDSKTTDVFGLGPGVGVIELCLVSDLHTGIGVATTDGKCTLNIEDPYKLTMITDSDIEIALRQALAEEGGMSGVLDVTANFQLEQAQELDRQLNELRRNRGVSEINFEFVFGSGNAIGKVIEINFEFDENTVSTVPAPQSLSATEIVRAIEIIKKLSSYLTLQQRGAAAFQDINKDFNGVRQRMRNEYAGNSIIQPMDSVHVFINSNTKDESITYENRPDVELGGILQSFTEKYDTMSNELIEQEASQIAPGIPIDIYRLIRDPSMWRSDGISVFAGVVDKISQSYKATTGQFNMSISVTNNFEYLRMTKINDLPSLVQPTKFLDDPLTPFDIDVNSNGLITNTPQLSKENIGRLQYLRFDDGFYLGESVKDGKRLFQDVEGKGADRRISLQHVPGLVYKWKTGMVTETLNVNVDRPLNGDGNSLSDALSTVPQINFTTPFASLDSADVISILVTGQPYNYSNFLKNAMSAGTFSVSGSNNNSFYFNHLFDLFERNKPITGNFISAKSGLVDPKDAINAFSIKEGLNNNNNKLNSLQSELARAEDAAKQFSTAGIIDPGTAKITEDLKSKIATLQAKISGSRSNLASVQASASLAAGGIKINTIGDDVLVGLPELNLVEVNKRIRYAIKKKPEEVRYNQDKNFFIVSSQYDQDTDIQAFASALRDSNKTDLMKSDYQYPLDLATKTAESINFELFTDCNGNIVFRPPEYNKTPLSLLLKMISLSKGDGTSLAPKFVIDMFQARTNTVEDRLLQTDLEIYEKMLLLGLNSTQTDIQLFLLDSLTKSKVDERDASVLQGNESVFLAPFYLDTAAAIKESIAPARDIFTPAERSDLLNANNQDVPVDPTGKAERIIRIRNQLNTINGLTDKILEPTTENVTKIIEEIDVFDSFSLNGATQKTIAFQQLASIISQRQLLLQTYGKLEKNKAYFTDAGGATAPQPLSESIKNWTSSLTGNPDIPKLPQILQDLIENDLSNDDGPRSGKRFIINDDTIISMDFNIEKPEFNRVTVTGNSDAFGKGDLSQGDVQNSMHNIFQAQAVDFDSWRQYGLRQPQEFHRLDFVNAETQCAPYAIFKLIEQRKRIHRGTITVIGNEYYQPGDVVYVNDKSMLYYVINVDHNLSFSNGVFTTTLTLGYGHALGEYIPTPMDIIGKGMLSTQRRAYGGISTKRFPMPSNSVFILETLFAQDYTSIDTRIASNTLESYKLKFYTENKDKIANIIIRAADKINSNSDHPYKIEIRGYFINSTKTFIQKSQLTGQDITLNDPNTIGDSRQRAQFLISIAKEAFDAVSMLPDVLGKIDASKIIAVDPIDISAGKNLSDNDKAARRFPSPHAWGMASSLTDLDGLSLPLNAIDVVFIVDKSRRGDVAN